MNDVITQECTIHLHKKVYGVKLKKKSPKTIRKIKLFAEKMMRTKDIRIDTKLKKHIWSKAFSPTYEDEGSPHKLYTLVSHVPCASFKGLQTMNVENE
uniref:60S ribosomal protein L31 n=1 Tax=Octopus bimaculoides TaxID=37653 RepID=A0A0L8HLA7_OCTBM